MQKLFYKVKHQNGFRAVILQHGKPVYFSSGSLTSAEQIYQNLEREVMTAVWGIEKLHYFLDGKKFNLQTDQKPLISIFKKHLEDVSPRIQRIAIRSWPYQFQTEWIAGKNNSVADALSQRIDESEIELPIRAVNILTTPKTEDKDI